MTRRPNALEQSIDIAGTLTKSDLSTLADENSSLGELVTGQTGAVANITAVLAGIVTLTGLTGMSATGSPGRTLNVSGAGNANNNGSFIIVEYVSATSVKIYNPLGAAPDANNGAISWQEREVYSLQSDLNYARTDRRLIKGTAAYYSPIPTYQRPTAVGTNVDANLTNIASKTTDAKALLETRLFLASAVAQGDTNKLITDTGNLKHADAVDRTGVPVFDGADAGEHEATYVEIIAPSTEGALEVKGVSVGSIATVAGASLVDGEVFVINDGTNPAVTFEFDSNASVVQTPTLRAVTFSGASTADQIRDAIISAINNAPALNIIAESGGAALVKLTNKNPGTAGNQTITETVVNAGFVVTGMSGGTALFGYRIFGRTIASGGTSPNSVTIEFRAVAKGAALSTSVAYTWERDQPTTVNFYYAFRQRLDNLNENALRRTLVNGIVGDADTVQDIVDIRSILGSADNEQWLTGLTNKTNYFPFVGLDNTPNVTEALNALNSSIGNRDYTGTILVDNETITQSLQRLANAIAGSGFVRTIERLVSAVNANTAKTLPGAQTYTPDGTNNGQNLIVYWRGELRDPGSIANGDDYAETSATQITPFSKININEHINWFVYA